MLPKAQDILRADLLGEIENRALNLTGKSDFLTQTDAMVLHGGYD